MNTRGAWLEWFRADPVAALTEMGRPSGPGTFLIGAQRCHAVAHPDVADAILRAPSGTFARGPALVTARAFLGDGLLPMEDGEAHRASRRVVGGPLRPGAVREQAGRIARHIAEATDSWRDGQDVDVLDEMSRLTLAVVCACLLGIEPAPDAVRETRDALVTCTRMYDRDRMPSVVQRGPDFRSALAVIDSMGGRAVAAARSGEAAAAGASLGPALVAAADDGRLEERVVRDHIANILQAGHEPPAVALMWTWYELARNPAVEADVHREVDAVLARREATADDLPRLEVTTNAVAEAMRLYPPVWSQDRRALRDVDVAGLRVQAGDVVFINRYAIGRDRRWFPDPERFDPRRWEEGHGEGRAASQPFGSGPRGCVGEAFSWALVPLAVATVARRWRLAIAPGFELRFDPRLALLPAGGMPMTVRARNAG